MRFDPDDFHSIFSLLISLQPSIHVLSILRIFTAEFDKFHHTASSYNLKAFNVALTVWWIYWSKRLESLFIIFFRLRAESVEKNKREMITDIFLHFFGFVGQWWESCYKYTHETLFIMCFKTIKNKDDRLQFSFNLVNNKVIKLWDFKLCEPVNWKSEIKWLTIVKWWRTFYVIFFSFVHKHDIIF